MNVQAIVSEPVDLPASGASQVEQSGEGAEFEEVLAQAVPQKEQAQGEEGDAAAEDGTEQAEAALAAEAVLAPIAPEARVLTLLESIALSAQQTMNDDLPDPATELLRPVASDLEADQPARESALVEGLAAGIRKTLPEGMPEAVTGIASQAPTSLAEPLPETGMAPAAIELTKPTVVDDAVAGLPIARPLVTESADRTLPEAAQAASNLQIKATGGGGTAMDSETGAQDAALRAQTPLAEPEAPPPTAAGSEFAAALEARDEARPAPAPPPAPAVPLAPIGGTPGVTTPAGTSQATSLPAAGAPEEVLPVHVEWLAARQGGNARISLHPPELGELELMVKVRGSAVDIVIRAQEPAAQLAAVQSRDLLVDALSGRDLHIDQFDVRGLQTDMSRDDDSAQTNAQAQQDASARAGGQNREGTDDSSGSGELAENDASGPTADPALPPPVVDMHTAVDLLA
ncbi:MAG: flagellar hook-length control protein FliK [bacterium]|nr:flagellar hook-length control protein FliK [bacterium]